MGVGNIGDDKGKISSIGSCMLVSGISFFALMRLWVALDVAKAISYLARLLELEIPLEIYIFLQNQDARQNNG